MENRYRKDMTGEVFGRLTVVGFSHVENGIFYWNCKCECGKDKVVSCPCLRSKNTRSCGCLGIESRILHGMSRSKEYIAWTSMIYRCNNPRAKFYNYYGGSGIYVCDEWVESFQAFYDHIGPMPSSKHTIDRYPLINGNYVPGNVRWATRLEQARGTSRNINIEINGVVKCAAEWAEIYKISRQTLYFRLRTGWNHVEAVITPIDKRKSRSVKIAS